MHATPSNMVETERSKETSFFFARFMKNFVEEKNGSEND